MFAGFVATPLKIINNSYTQTNKQVVMLKVFLKQSKIRV